MLVGEFWKAFLQKYRIPTLFFQINENFIEIISVFQDHFVKSEKLKYFISNFQSFITQLKLGHFSKSQVVLNFSWSELQENGLIC